MKPRIVALICGRLDDDRFPGRNLFPLVGRPMMVYPIMAAQHAKRVDRVFMTTDAPAIARAPLRNPELLIFDEATSALDAQSEASVQEAIASIARDRTVPVIAHRLSSVIRADKIVVIENGCVVQEGTHAVLVGGGRLYAALYGKAEE